MPELPEVETVCVGLAKVLVGMRFAQVEPRRRDLRVPFPPDLAERLMGRSVVSVTRRAKYILMELDGDDMLLLHLGMSGRLTVGPDNGAPPGKHDHLICRFAGGDGPVVMTFTDPRRFGLCDLLPKAVVSQHKLLRGLGVEPLGPELTPAWLGERLRGKTTTIKAALLDQRLIAGLGNIYVCEALFHAGIRPTRRAGLCSQAQIAKLVPAIRKVLRAAIAAGGSSLRDYAHTDGRLGYFQHQFCVYDREGEPCPGCACSLSKTHGIRRVRQGGRSSFYCATKQV